MGCGLYIGGVGVFGVVSGAGCVWWRGRVGGREKTFCSLSFELNGQNCSLEFMKGNQCGVVDFSLVVCVIFQSRILQL